MTDWNVTLPPIPDRPRPDLPDGTFQQVLDLINSTTVSRFAAEETMAHGGIDALYRLFVARLVDNLTAWRASGDWPDRRQTAAELLAELADEGDLDLTDPANMRLLQQALNETEEATS